MVSAKLLGVTFCSNLKFDEHVKNILTICSQRCYLLKCLKAQGLPAKQLNAVFTRESRMLRASLPSSGRLSVCLSVCLSVTLVSCIKTVQARITKFLLWAAQRSLVYRDKISCNLVQGFPSNEGVEEGYPLKRRHFAVIGSNNVETVADRYIHAAYHNKL